MLAKSALPAELMLNHTYLDSFIVLGKILRLPSFHIKAQKPKKTWELRWQAAVKSLQLVVSSKGMNIFDFHYVFIPQLIYVCRTTKHVY